MSNPMEKLEQAKMMLDKGLINQTEYAIIKSDVMKSLGMTTNPPVSSPQPQSSPFDGDTNVGSPLRNDIGADDLSGIGGATTVNAHGLEIGQYRLLELLGQGGMGAVYRAQHKNEKIAKMRGDVAVKLIKSDFASNPSLRERFVQEAGLGMKVNHPNIAGVIDFVEEEDQIAFIMDFVDGTELTELMTADGMSVSDAIGYLRPLAGAIDYLHANNIIHRDLKPANVKVRSDGSPVILDLGIAKDVSESNENMTQTGTAMGTQAYMAPEQLDAKNVDGRADQYAFALIAYELLGGGLPWKKGESGARIVVAKMTGGLEPLHKKGVSKSVSDSVMKGLSLSPDERFASCLDFVGDIERAEQNDAQQSRAEQEQEDERRREEQRREQERQKEAEREEERRRKAEEEERRERERAEQEAKKKEEERRREEQRRRDEKARAAELEKEEVRAREEQKRKAERRRKVLEERKKLEQEYVIEQKRQLSIEKKTKEIVVQSSSFFGLFSSTVEFPMVEIPAGWFMMGALPNDKGADDREKPRHKVTLTKSFWMGKYPCTQELYKAVMGKNPSEFKGSKRPVENVSWCDAVLFCNKLSEMEGLEPVYVLPEPFENDNDWSKNVKWNKDANGYRLPTEAEWEYCARGGESHLYSGSYNIDEVAWYKSNSNGKAYPVGKKKPNGFGLYDMSGNVWEWAWDPFDVGVYKRGSSTDIIVDSSSLRRVRRGGGRDCVARRARVSYRSGGDASYRNNLRGFRFLRTF